MNRIFTLTAALGLFCTCIVVLHQHTERTQQPSAESHSALTEPASTKKAEISPPQATLTSSRHESPTAPEPMPEAPEPTTTVETAEPSPLSQLPESEQASFHQALQQALLAIEPMPQEAAHLPQNADASHFAANAGQRLTARFLKNGGVRLQTGQPGMEKEATLRLKSSTASHQWHSDETRIHTTRGEITEWYQNRPEGLEHGFTISTPTHTEGPLLLPIVLENLIAREDTTRPGDLLFTDPATDAPVFAYQNLKVWDADGTVLGAHMRPTPDGFLIAVNDTSARYPITVDPLIVTLDERIDSGSTAPGNDFGSSVAIDGDTIAVGASGYSGLTTQAGAVFVFIRTPAGWALQQKILRYVGVNDQNFGISVDISGNLLAAASRIYGGVVIYQRTGTTWTSIQSFHPQPYHPTEARSYVVKLEGTRLIVGCASDTPHGTNSGSVFIYEQVGAVWSEAKLTPPDGQAGDRFGKSIAASGDIIAVGSPNRSFSSVSPNTGRVHLYKKSGTSWTLQQVLTAGSSTIANAEFGNNLSLDGNTLAVTSRITANDLRPTAHLFTQNANTWTLQQEIRPITTGNNYSFNVALSNNLLALSTNLLTSNAGGLFLYRRTGTTWSQIFDTTIESPVVFTENFGFHLDASGNTWVFSRSSESSRGWPYGGADVFELSGNSLVHRQKLDAGLSKAGDFFGQSVAIHGDTAVVGVPFADTARGTHAGAALVFVRNGNQWIRLSRLYARNGARFDRFGRSVAISADTIVVGAPDHASKRGAIYVYARPTSGGIFPIPTLLQKTGGLNGEMLGRSLGIDGNRIIAGAPLATVDGKIRAGQAVIFTRSGNNWSQTTLHARRIGSFWSPENDIVANAAFGTSVSIHGNSIAIGAPYLNWTSPVRNGVGRVYIFTHSEASGWTPNTSLNPPTAVGGDWFGYSLSLNDQVLAVGAPEGFIDHHESWLPPSGNTANGKVHIFRNILGSFIHHQTITQTPASPAYSPNFGVSVAMHAGNRLLIGAHKSSTGTGSAYLYSKATNNDWTLETQITPTTNNTINKPVYFGHSTAIHGDTIIIGAPESHHNTYDMINAGYAYLFRITDPSAVIPALQITRSGTNAILTWTHTPGWTLHRSPTLLPGSWTPVTVTTPGTHTHPITSGTPKMFFRLQR